MTAEEMVEKLEQDKKWVQDNFPDNKEDKVEASPIIIDNFIDDWRAKKIETQKKEEELKKLNVDVEIEKKIEDEIEINETIQALCESAVVNREKCSKINEFRLSYIEDYEEEKVKGIISEDMGFEPFHVPGWKMAVVVYERPEDVAEFQGKKTSIIIPTNNSDKHINCVGLVIYQGPQCYNYSTFKEPLHMRMIRMIFGRWMKPSKFVPWCKVGDWVIFDRNAGPQINYRGLPVTIIEDKNIHGIVPRPEYVSRY